jgi:putative mRNA 3-end processing factor
MSAAQLSLFSSGPVESSDKGILLTEAGLWLDATESKPLSFVSHAHSDHICAHERALLTAPTRRFLDLRLGRHETDLRELEFNHPYRIGESVVTLFPAGHILGSAQILVENSRRIVYTGDFRLRPNPVVERAEVKKCDILVMEATFGSPKYAFPGEDEVGDMLKREIDRALARGRVPIVRAYALGKAQEVVAILNRLGYRVAVSPDVEQYCEIYESFGVKLGSREVLDSDSFEPEGKTLVAGSTATLREFRERFPSHHAIFVSGWGIDPSAKYRYGVDVVIPLSDHADYCDLLEYVRQAEPKEVLVTHGVPEFARDLSRLGFKAACL